MKEYMSGELLHIKTKDKRDFLYLTFNFISFNKAINKPHSHLNGVTITSCDSYLRPSKINENSVFHLHIIKV